MNKKFINKITSGILFCTVLAYGVPVLAYTKDETVYTKLSSDGTAYDTIVNSHIKNEEKLDIINDLTDLLNIENSKDGKEANEDGNKLVWNSNGEDVYYQGKSNKELPIECKITYELNGEEISKDEIAGKSGEVKIKIKYINKDSHNVNLNGKNITMYTPFVTVCGTIVNNDTNKNIKVKNGKAVDDGSKTVIMGMAVPGMSESLAISQDKFEIPDQIEITMETENFKLGNIITYVTPKILEESDIEAFNELDDIYASINTLQTSSEMLVEGANTLKDGTNIYNEKSKEFNNAMNQMKSGVNTVNNTYTKIDNGITTLNNGSKDLENGAKQLNSGIKEATSSLSSLPQEIGKLYNGTKTLNEGVNGSAGLVLGVKSLKDNLTKTTTTSITELNKNNVVLQAEIDKLELEKKEITNQITTLTNLKAKLTLDADKTTMQTTITQLENRKKDIDTRVISLKTMKNENAAIITALTPSKDTNAKLQALDAGINKISEGTKSLELNVGKLNEAAQSLPQALTKLSNGSAELEKGTKSLFTGANTLNSGSKALKNGIQTLDTNAERLLDANNQLTQGANTLSEGATSLSEGMEQFNKEGIEKICNYINGNLKDITSRLEKLKGLAEQYNNFTMLEDGNNGNVKFIMITDSIKEEEASKEEMISDKKK